jgi:hypothetical protein
MSNEPWNTQAAEYGLTVLQIPRHRLSGYLQWVKAWREREGERWEDIHAALEQVRGRVGPFHPAALFSFWDEDASLKFRLELAKVKKLRPKKEAATGLKDIFRQLGAK